MHLLRFKPFFRRQQEARGELPTTFIYSLPQKVRIQILMLWRDVANFIYAEEILNKLHLETGQLLLCEFKKASRRELDAEYLDKINELCTYFEICKDEEMALSILELICYTNKYNGNFVTLINERLKTEGIGYRFYKTDNSGYLCRIEDEVFSSECTEKCLGILGNKEYSDVLKHYLNSYKELKDGNFDDALIDLRQAVESLLKTRFRQSGISYNPKDTYARLLDTAQKHVDSGPYKFHDFKMMIQSVGSASNAGGHGQPQGNALNIDEVFIRFMINQATANLLFLAEIDFKS